MGSFADFSGLSEDEFDLLMGGALGTDGYLRPPPREVKPLSEIKSKLPLATASQVNDLLKGGIGSKAKHS